MASPSTRQDNGTFTAAGVEITCNKPGFKPKSVRLVGANNVMLFWDDSMPAASAEKTLANGTRTQITTNGITPTAYGFTLGADAQLNVAQSIKYNVEG